MANKTTFNMPSIDEIVKDKAMQQARELDALINDMVDSLSKVSDGKNLSKYWKTQDELIQDVIKSQKEFNREVNNVNASNLLKVVNALKAIHGNDISDIIPDFSGLEKSMQAAKNMIGSLDSAFDVKSFERTFASFEGLKAYGLDLESFFKHFELDIDTQRLRESLQIAEDATNELRRELHSTQAELTSKKIELDSFIDGSGLTEQIEKLKKLEDEIERIRKNASREFKTFLRANDFVGQDLDEDGQFYKYFDDIKNGTLSARQAIANFKSEYGHLLQENYNQSGGLFNIQQIQAFENKLETVLSRVEEISRQMNNIVENGVMTKAMQNLSVDDTISQSQRDLFANVLKDEEALSSIAGVLKKIIDESVTLQGVNNKTFDEEQFNRLLILFEKIESSLSSMKAVFVDVGDGEEFSPLLKMINNVQESIEKLSTSVKGIGLNMNIDVGSDKELETQFQDKVSKALIAYQRLFDHIKMSGVGGSVINDAFFNFDLNHFDTTIGKVKALQQFIDKTRDDAKALYGGQDVLKQDTDAKFWNQASAALAQIKIVEKRIKASTDTSPLENLFGKTDLTEVVTQLNLIVDKLGEISTTASEFKNVFANGFNVSASVEEIEKLTSRVKELEDELSKIKMPTSTSPVETNISSPIKDTFQGDKIEQVTTSAKELDKTLEQAVDVPTDDFDNILTKLDLTKSKLSEIVKITKQTHIDADGKPAESYTLKDKYGSTEIYGESSNPQLLRSNIVEYDAKQAEKLVAENIRINKAYYDAKEKEEQEYQKLKAKFLAEGKRQEQEYYAELQKQADAEVEYYRKRDEEYERLRAQYKAEGKAQEDAYNAQVLKEQAEAWDKNVKAIQEYMDANTKLNNLKAQDKGTGKKSSEIAYQTKEVERLEKVVIEARAALSSMINPHEAPIDDWNKWLEAMKQFDQATEGSARSVAQLEDALRNMAKSQSDKIGSVIDSNQAHLDKLRPSDGNRSVDFEKAVQQYREAIIALKEFHETLDSSTPLTKEQSTKYEELSKSLKEARVEMEKFSAAEKGSTEGSRWKEIDKITKYLEKNTRISKIAKQQLEDLVNTLKNVSGINVDSIHLQFNKIAEAERAAGREGKRFWDIITDKAVYGAAAQLAGYYLSLTDFIRYGKQMVDTVIEIDTATTELQKVSNATSKRLEENFKNSAETAKDLGSSISEVISASADWSKMGFDIDDAEELARVSTLYVNVGDGIDVEEANNSLISTLQGFQMDAEEAESIVDRFNEVANNYAIDSAGIGEALQRSAASFNASHTDLSKSIALITATNEVVQDPTSVGTLWKTLSARIRGASTELSELGEETDEYTESTSKLRDLVKGLTGFDIMADEDTFKDIYEIILGIGQEWENLTDLEQASLGEALAGKRNANALYAVLGNIDTLEEAYKTAEESAGSAMREQENYEQHIQYSLDRLTASAQEWSATLVDSGVIKWFVDLANAIVEVSTAITPLGTLALGGGLFAGIKNVGTTNYISCRQNCVLF